MSLANPEEFVSCPYNQAHSVVSHRMQFHLRKCRLQHPDAEKVICPFNSTHVVNRVELEWHLEWCKERIAMDKMMCQVGSDSQFVAQPTVIPVAPIVTSTNEEWGDEVATDGSVLDKLKEVTQSKPAFSHKICATKSEKKAYKNAERVRFQQVLDTKTSKNEMKQGISVNERKNIPQYQEDKSGDSEQPREPEKPKETDGPRDAANSQKSFFPTLENAHFPQLDDRRQPAPQPEANQTASSRDLKNPWGSRAAVKSTSFQESLSQARQEASREREEVKQEGGSGVRRGWPTLASSGPTSPQDEASSGLKDLNIGGGRRDPGNPWKMRNIGANFRPGPECNDDFPILPMSGTGRARRLPK